MDWCKIIPLYHNSTIILPWCRSTNIFVFQLLFNEYDHHFFRNGVQTRETFCGKWPFTVPFFPTATAYWSWVVSGFMAHTCASMNVASILQAFCFSGFKGFVDNRFSWVINFCGCLDHKNFPPLKFNLWKYLSLKNFYVSGIYTRSANSQWQQWMIVKCRMVPIWWYKTNNRIHAFQKRPSV